MTFTETIKVKLGELKFKVREGAEKLGDYLEEHSSMVYTIVSVGGAVIAGTIAGISQVGSTNRESCNVEDDVTGLNYRTKRPLTNQQILELSDRMIDGESMGGALDEMGVLKKERRRK